MTWYAVILRVVLCTVITLKLSSPPKPSTLGELCLNLALSFVQRDVLNDCFEHCIILNK